MNGKVYLVGAGPGDPELITLKGLECIKNADVIIYDYLASPSLLKHAREHAEIIYVGKKGGDHTLSQDRINALIAEKAQKGFTVTRLKGGDPFIFGRGGEEAEVLIDARIPFEIIPGVTSAIAAPAYALVRWGTTPKQTTVSGTLDTIVERTKAAGLKPPAIIVVGHVVKLREKMRWFETRPLMGQCIVVTRAREQASDLVKRLSDLGAECLECPTIKVSPPQDVKPLDQAMENLSSYDWLIFTSVNGVNFFFERLFQKNKDVRALKDIHTAVIGPATEKRLFDFGLKSDIVPESYRAESVVKAFAGKDVTGRKILLPRAKEARPVLPLELKKMGAVVDEVTAYCTHAVKDNTDVLSARLKERSIDMITFTSSSTVKNFRALFPNEDLKDLMRGVTIASIGPVTADTARDLGFDVHIIAESYTIPGLCQAILTHFS